MNLTLAIIAAAFLAVAIIAPLRQDYFFYLEIWYHVQRGENPWFTVWGQNGQAPLNAYGPLFNLLAGLAWINPAMPQTGPQLCVHPFCDRYDPELRDRPSSVRDAGSRIARAVLESLSVGRGRVLRPFRPPGRARLRGRRPGVGRGWDITSGLSLAGGVLLKYLPIVLLPFLAIDGDRSRPRVRFLAASLATIAVGLAESWLIWGSSTFLPLMLAATRQATTLSIFRFLHGRYSPLYRLGISGNYESFSTPAMLLALGASGGGSGPASRTSRRRPWSSSSSCCSSIALAIPSIRWCCSCWGQPGSSGMGPAPQPDRRRHRHGPVLRLDRHL